MIRLGKPLHVLLYSSTLAIERFFRVYMASSKHSGVGRIRDSYANPRLRLGQFAYLSGILPTPRVFR